MTRPHGFRSRLTIGILAPLLLAGSAAAETVTVQASKPDRQMGRQRLDDKAGSVYGSVLGGDWGGRAGDWAEYHFKTSEPLAAAELTIRYARQFGGTAKVRVAIDGTDVGLFPLPSTGGWGEQAGTFNTVTRSISGLGAAEHVMRVTAEPTTLTDAPLPLLPADPLLDLVGSRVDKNSVGHGKNVAIYFGSPSRFFYATHEMGDVFTVADGATEQWFPDYTVVAPAADRTNVVLDQLTIAPAAAPAAPAAAPIVAEHRQVCVTADDVVVSRAIVENPTDAAVTRTITVAGDCRKSFDYRGRPGGVKQTRRDGDVVVMTDHNVFPNALPDGLSMAVGSTAKPTGVETGTAGTYRLTYEITVAAHGTLPVTFACAFAPSADAAAANLKRTLADPDPLGTNRKAWRHFYTAEVPRFDCSDQRLTALYAFRWFLLKFSTAGGDLGGLKYPVDLEGREAFQTYCCYSAPFMAFDLNWADDPRVGFGQLMNMSHVAYDDGRFPWYATPLTNHVPVDHASATGQSLLPWTAWKFYLVHGDKKMLAEFYPAMKKNMDWWIADRDPDGNGLFTIADQLETGMDDLHRRWKNGKPKRYEAIDASSYCYMNLTAVANMARELGKTDDANYYAGYARKTAAAVQNILWDPTLERYRDRNPDNGERTDYNSITIFYPMFAGIGGDKDVAVARRYLLNPKEYWTAYPVPALSQTDPEFDPEHRYWAGLTWPATNSHVFEGLANLAKTRDRTLLPDAAELFRRMLALHLRPDPDFYEHYNPLDGRPLSSFRDYMHSWWIDTIVRQVAGFDVNDDGSVTVDALPLGLTSFSLRGVAFRTHQVDVVWQADGGLTVTSDGKVILRQPGFRPGGTPVRIAADAF